MDDSGRYTPAVNRFPSAANGAGFKPLADYVHSLGLKFGIHILRGIPKLAVEKNLPIAGSSFHAADAADSSDTCPWNFDNYGIDGSKPGAQAYYDSIAKLYASWEVDLIKVDCISSRPYKGDEIRMLSTALAKTGRPIVLSLSPGPAPLEKTDEMRKYAQMWRISNDIWDLWHSTVDYPQGLGDQFANVAKWAGKAQPGHWPDADMLPLGYLGPAPGWGQPRYHPAYARRAENICYAVVYFSVAADGRRRLAQGRCMDNFFADQSRGHRGGPAFDRQSSSNHDGQNSGVGGKCG